jgi:hypothetical protein
MKLAVLSTAFLLGACSGSGRLEEGELESSSSTMTSNDDKENTGRAVATDPAPVESAGSNRAGAAEASPREVDDTLAKLVLVRAYSEPGPATPQEIYEKTFKLVKELADAGNGWAVQTLMRANEEGYGQPSQTRTMVYFCALGKVNAMAEADQTWTPTLIEEYKKRSILVNFAIVCKGLMQIAQNASHPDNRWARTELLSEFKQFSGHGSVPFSSVAEDVIQIAQDTNNPSNEWAINVVRKQHRDGSSLVSPAQVASLPAR